MPIEAATLCFLAPQLPIINAKYIAETFAITKNNKFITILNIQSKSLYFKKSPTALNKSNFPQIETATTKTVYDAINTTVPLISFDNSSTSEDIGSVCVKYPSEEKKFL